MKTLFLFLLIASAGMARGQVTDCYQDSLRFTDPLSATSTATLGDTSTYCNPFDCSVFQDCHYWSVPSGQIGIYFESVDSGAYHLRIIQDCRYILWDTCGVVPMASATAPYTVRLVADLLPNCVVMVCGLDPVQFAIQIKPHPNHHTLQILYDMDTCNLLVSIGDPLGAGETPTYLTFPYAERVEKYPLPVGKYFEVWRDRKKSRVIEVR